MSFRASQIGSEIMKHLGSMLLQEMPVYHFGVITITDVIVTPGLEYARIFISSLKNDHTIVEKLNQKSKKLAFQVSKKMALRKIPEFRFIYDDSAERYEKIENMNREAP